MIIRILPELRTQDQWLAFYRREPPYCFVRDPECLVDFQSNFLAITLLHDEIRNGKEAIKYSLGARASNEPAWRFISACDYNLTIMIAALESLDFKGNVRDNPFVADRELSIRKFFSKDRAIISPSVLSALEPVTALPVRWSINAVCRLLANRQAEALRNETLSIGDSASGTATRQRPAPAPATETLLLRLIECPEQWRAEVRGNRLFLLQEGTPRYSFRPCPKPRS